MNADLFPEARRLPTEAEIDDRYTTRATLAWCMAKAGVDAFDLDVAASAEAHHAPLWYSKRDNGLLQPWRGRVWCNPPFSDLAPWVLRAREAIGSGAGNNAVLVAQLLPGNRTEQRWWQEVVEPSRDRRGSGLTTHFLPGRTRFGHPGNPEGLNVGSPPFGCVLLVWRRP